MSRSSEAGITLSAASPFGYDETLIRRRKIEELFARFGVVHDGSDRNKDFLISPGMAGALAAFAMTSAFGGVLGVEAQMQKSVVMFASDKDHITAASAIAAARAAARNKFLAAKCQATVAAVAGFHGYYNFINEH